MSRLPQGTVAAKLWGYRSPHGLIQDAGSLLSTLDFEFGVSGAWPGYFTVTLWEIARVVFAWGKIYQKRGKWFCLYILESTQKMKQTKISGLILWK